MKKVTFPPSVSTPDQPVDLECETSIVVVGANGAGKSRLGAWLEISGSQKALIHRIAAQRSLVFPTSASPIGMNSARDAFLWAPRPVNWTEEVYEREKFNLRVQHRYGGSLESAETAPLNDFEALLILLFSDNYTNLLSHETAQRKNTSLVPIPDSLLRKVQSLWEEVLPNRRLQLNSGEVRVFAPTSPDSNYSARAMSDGERVVFYLIGQCLCAASGAILVIDEPEIHLHKAIQNALWNSIEAARTDCTFVYLTHDLGFAADRSGATRVCVTDYSERGLSWYEIPEQSAIPNDVYLEILGSRKPVLFVEGTIGSYDVDLYRIAYPRFTVKPLGGCSEVIAATKAFRAVRDFHHIECFGIIDRDYLESAQISAYERHGVFAPSVAEVENLFLLPNVIKAVADQLVLDSESVFEKVKAHVLGEFGRDQDTQAMNATRHSLALAMGRFSSDKPDIAGFATDFGNYVHGIDVTAMHTNLHNAAEVVRAAGDYVAVLRTFNKKDLVKSVDRFFGITKSTYVEKVKEMAKRGKGDIPKHMLEYLPNMVDKLPNIVTPPT